jgi:hypothetical protein
MPENAKRLSGIQIFEAKNSLDSGSRYAWPE